MKKKPETMVRAWDAVGRRSGHQAKGSGARRGQGSNPGYMLLRTGRREQEGAGERLSDTVYRGRVSWQSVREAKGSRAVLSASKGMAGHEAKGSRAAACVMGVMNGKVERAQRECAQALNSGLRMPQAKGSVARARARRGSGNARDGGNRDMQVQRGENMREAWRAGLGRSWRTAAASRSMAQLTMSSGGFEGARVPASVPPRDGSVRAAPSSAAPAGLPSARGISDSAATPGSQAAAAPIPE